MANESGTVDFEQLYYIALPPGHDLAKFRESQRKESGCEIHIRFKLGPMKVISRNKIECPIALVDDEFLELNLQLPIPKAGWTLYFFHYIKTSDQPTT